MSWRDDLLPASYNDVPFSYMEHDASGGRRLDVHEFPNRDRATIIDLGRKATELSVDAVLIGDDYLARRDRLLAELDRGGVGQLSHPYLGLLRVGVRSWRLSETIERGRGCRISMTFVVGDAVTAGAAIPMTADKVSLAAAALTRVNTTGLAAVKKPTSPASVLERVAQLQSLASQLTTHVSQLRGWADSTLVAPLANVLRSAQAIRNDLQALVTLPGTLADTLSSLAQGIANLFEQDSDAGFAVAMSWATQPAEDPFSAWLALEGVAHAARFMSQRTFDTSSSAIEAQSALLAAIETLQDSAPDEIYVALIDVRAAVVADVTVRAGQLPQITTYTPRAVLPALVVAHLIYGDAAWADDVVARNGVRHPGFVPGGQSLEVLSNG